MLREGVKAVTNDAAIRNAILPDLTRQIRGVDEVILKTVLPKLESMVESLFKKHVAHQANADHSGSKTLNKEAVQKMVQTEFRNAME